MESSVTGIITAIDLPDVLFQTVLDNVLQKQVSEVECVTNTSPEENRLTDARKEVGFYLIAQTGSALQQGFPSIFIDN